MAPGRTAAARTNRSNAESGLRRIEEWAASKLETATYRMVDVKLSDLEFHHEVFLKAQATLESVTEDEDSLKAEQATRLELHELYVELKATLLEKIDKLRPKPTPVAATAASSTPSFQTFVTMRPLGDFKYKGGRREWSKFWERFNSWVHSNKNLTKEEKMLHLIEICEGEARDVIGEMDVTAEGYDEAIKELRRAFEDKPMLVEEHIAELFKLPKVPKDDGAALRQFVNKANGHMRALETLGRPVETWCDIIIFLFLTKLDRTLLADWKTEAADERFPCHKRFIKFLQFKCQLLERIDANNRLVQPSKSSPSPAEPPIKAQTTSKKAKSGSTLVAGDDSAPATGTGCLICNRTNHTLQNCRRFKGMTVPQRLDTVRRYKACETCLKCHPDESCQSTGTCIVCKQSHHTYLHQESAAKQLSPTDLSKASTSTANNSKSEKATDGSTCVASCQNSLLNPKKDQSRATIVVLPTAIVNIVDRSGDLIPCRALVDSGSAFHFIRREIVQQLRIQCQKAKIRASGIGQTSMVSEEKAQVTLQSRVNSFSLTIDVQVVANITSPQPVAEIPRSALEFPSNIQLADPQFFQPNKIDLLIGAEYFFQLLQAGNISLSSNACLQNSVFGWLASGRFSESPLHEGITCVATLTDETTEKQLERFWTIEEKDDNKPIHSAEDIECEKFFLQTVQRASDGRFVVKLPFKRPPTLLGDSRRRAERCCASLEARLHRQGNEKFREKYIQFMREFIGLNHMELADPTHLSGPNYFIPHHGVVSSGKFRTVFNGSSPTSSGLSLNDLLYSGPVVQPDLFAILLRARFPIVLLSSDVTKMYRQIYVHPDDRKYQLILWRETREEPIRIYTINRVVYGLAPSAFCATKCMNLLAEECRNDFPLASKAILEGCYVDNVFYGADSPEEARQLRKELDEMLARGGMELRKWCSNDESALEGVPEERREEKFQIDVAHSAVTTLGKIWGSDDHFRYSFHPSASTEWTKRSVLAEVMRIFDPLGLVSPVVVIAKTFLRELWSLELDWDEKLPPETQSKWSEFHSQLGDLKQLAIPRLVRTPGSRLSLHCFADASGQAYGACLYIVAESSEGLQSTLLCSKSRVAPTKITTIPRLELCAALLAAELAFRVQKIVSHQFEAAFYWTDAEIVLHWLSKPGISWKQFVGNRVDKILKLTERRQWRHVPGKLNPADLVSRGVLPAPLLAADFWFAGPSFLREDSRNWPQQPLILQFDAPDEERKHHSILDSSASTLDPAAATLLAADNRVAEREKWILDNKFLNDFGKLRRSFAWLLRAANNFNSNWRQSTKQRILGPLSAAEIRQAELFMVKTVQQSVFAPELEALKHGPQALLANIRQVYWPLNGRTLARKVFNSCLDCFKIKPKLATQCLGPLPSVRLQPTRPFQHVGVDLCGPFTVTPKLRGRATYKAYGCVFVCFTTRAVHLEVVSEQSTEAFLATLRRFIGRRGVPECIYSDNMRGFVGAKTELDRLFSAYERENEKLVNFCSEKGIAWKFSPPCSPHHGGLWEAAVKSTKHHLKRCMPDTPFTYEELLTLLAQIEGILNSRPLVPLTDDPADFDFLTPGHFLIGSPLTAAPEPTTRFDLPRIHLVTRWRRMQVIRDEFWRRWSSEYLSHLQKRSKWLEDGENIKIGTLVLIKDQNQPPHRWSRGRVEKVHPGKDERIRVVTLKTSTGELVRDVREIAPLPLELDNLETTAQQAAGCRGSRE